MAASTIVPTIIPTGGAIALTIAPSGAMTLSRATSGLAGLSAFTLLFSGQPQYFYVDVGDALPAPLDPTMLYVYQLTDANGTLQTTPVQPVATLNPQLEPLTYLLRRLLQAAVNSLVLPPGVRPIQNVLQAMPLVGIPAMPFMVLNLDLLQQEEIPIGQNVPTYDITGTATLTGFVHRVYKVSVLSMNGPERDFYRDALVGIFEVITTFVLGPAGLNNTHRYQTASGQVADDITGKDPGFYYADGLLEFDGTLSITIGANLGLIEYLSFTGTTPDGTQLIALTQP